MARLEASEVTEVEAVSMVILLTLGSLLSGVVETVKDEIRLRRKVTFRRKL